MIEERSIHFMSKAAATDLAATNQKDEPDWKCVVTHNESRGELGYFVTIFDEDGNWLGTL